MKKVLAGLIAAVSLLQGQAFTAAELEAIPLVPPRAGKTVTKALFDGKTLNGWRGNPDYWSVKDGALTGKSSDKMTTNFLFTVDKYTDFRLTLLSKMVESDNHAGVAFWGEIAEHGENKWYTRGPLVVFPNPSMWDYIPLRGSACCGQPPKKSRASMNGSRWRFWRRGIACDRHSMGYK